MIRRVKSLRARGAQFFIVPQNRRKQRKELHTKVIYQISIQFKYPCWKEFSENTWKAEARRAFQNTGMRYENLTSHWQKKKRKMLTML